MLSSLIGKQTTRICVESVQTNNWLAKTDRFPVSCASVVFVLMLLLTVVLASSMPAAAAPAGKQSDEEKAANAMVNIVANHTPNRVKVDLRAYSVLMNHCGGFFSAKRAWNSLLTKSQHVEGPELARGISKFYSSLIETDGIDVIDIKETVLGNGATLTTVLGHGGGRLTSDLQIDMASDTMSRRRERDVYFQIFYLGTNDSIENGFSWGRGVWRSGRRVHYRAGGQRYAQAVHRDDMRLRRWKPH